MSNVKSKDEGGGYKFSNLQGDGRVIITFCAQSAQLWCEQTRCIRPQRLQLHKQ